MALTGLVLAAFMTILQSQPLRECNNYQECINQTITKPQISCAGYESCTNGASLTSNDRTSGFVDCNGYRSCAFANSISSKKNLNCVGYFSCDSVGSISTKVLSCSGVSACTQYDWINSDHFEYNVDNLLYCSYVIYIYIILYIF